MTNSNTSIGLLMEIVKPTTATAAAVDGVCGFNCGTICSEKDQSRPRSEVVGNNDVANKEIYPWDKSEECTSRLEDREDNRDDHDHSAKPDYSEYARDCEESHRQEDNEVYPSELDLVQVSSDDAAKEGCLFGEFGFGHFVLDLFSSLNPCRLKNLKDELKKAKESNAELEWELKTQLVRLRQQREAMESKLRREIDKEITKTKALQEYLRAEQLQSEPRDDEQVITDTAQTINTLQTQKKEKLPLKPLVTKVSSTIGVSSTISSAPEPNVMYSLDELHVAAE